MRAIAVAIPIATSLVLGGCAMPREFQAPEPLSSMPTDAPLMDAQGTAEIEVPTATPEGAERTFVIGGTDASGGVLPDIRIERLSVTESGLQDALQLALLGTGLTLEIEGGAHALERSGPEAVYGASGSLQDVLDRLARSMAFFWSVRGHTLVVEPERTFMVELPPVHGEDSLAGMTNSIQAFGAHDVSLDRLARTLIFRANARGLDRIKDYLAHVRASRQMIVYEVRIYEVDLSDHHEQGVNWNQLEASSLARPKPINASSSVAGTPALGGGDSASDLSKAISLTGGIGGGTGIGAVILGPKFNLNALVTFLKTQGTVKTVSQPRLALLNDSKGFIRVGRTQTYVSKVGSNLSNGVSEVTVETKDLRTGVELSLIGQVSEGTVDTDVELAVADANPFVTFTALGTNLSMPDTNDKSLRTNIRLPPGYTAVLGGITMEKQSTTRAIGASENTKLSNVDKSELVIAIRPTVVRFGEKRVATTASGVSK